MKLNELTLPEGTHKKSRRLGRGIGSGRGKTSGRGHKGDKARTGNGPRPGFEGGQNPIYRRLPMRGFNNFNFRTVYATVNVGDLQKMVDAGRLNSGETVTIAALQKIGLTKKSYDGLKILGEGELKAKLTVEAMAASATAATKISKAGGKLTILKVEVERPKKLPKKQAK